MYHTCFGFRLDSDERTQMQRCTRTPQTTVDSLITTCRLGVERWRGGDKDRHRERKEVCMTVSRTGIGKN